jgi:hypothetical protein
MRTFRTPLFAPAVRRGRGRFVGAVATVVGLLLTVGPTVRPADAHLAEPDDSSPERPGNTDAAPPEQPVNARRVPAERQHDLDFLLGSFRCEFKGNPQVGDSIIYMRTRPTLDGHFYQIDITQVKPNQPDLHGRWVLGWSEAEAQFVSYYYDENVMHGSSFSPGREGNEMTFTGTYFLASKGVVAVRDEFLVHDDNHFEINEYVKIGDEDWKYFDHQDCRRLH